jgi:hypothetical protein
LSKKRSGGGTFLGDNTCAAHLFSEHFYEKRYKSPNEGGLTTAGVFAAAAAESASVRESPCCCGQKNPGSILNIGCGTLIG